MKAKLQKLINNEIIMYLFFGGLTTAVNWVVYRLCDMWISGGKAASEVVYESALDQSLHTFLDKGLAGIIAWVAAVAFAYVTNRAFVFKEKAQGAKGVAIECGKFVGARVFTGVIEILGVPALIVLGLSAKLFGMDVAKLLVSVIVIVLNYIFSKLFVFKAKKEKKEETCTK